MTDIPGLTNVAKINLMGFKRIYIIIGTLVALIASALYYFFSYKNSIQLNMMLWFVIFIGWLIAFYQVYDNTKKISKTHKQKYFFLKLVFRIVPFALFIGNLFLLFYLGDARIEAILRNGPLKQTTAIVSVMPNPSGKGSNNLIATFEYSINGKTIKREVSDNHYQSGQIYIIDYVINYPEIFQIVKRIENR